MQNIINGYKLFKKTYFGENTDQKSQELFESLNKEGQKPKILVIACSDSRVDPAIVTNALPGDLFVVRNVANLVPPCEDGNIGYHGTSAALEFAVCGLGIKNIIVFGHSKCGGMQSLFNTQINREKSFLTNWMTLAKPAFNSVEQNHHDLDITDKADLCSKYSLINSLNNLRTFPWVEERLKNNQLFLHAWYFDISNGNIKALNETNQFVDL
jgi:carbonic anhydrase